MNRKLQLYGWVLAASTAIVLPIYVLRAEHEAGQKSEMHGTLVSLEHYIASDDAQATAPAAAMSSGPWALRTDDGTLIVLSNDAARMWRGDQPKAQLEPRGDEAADAAFGIEKQEAGNETQAAQGENQNNKTGSAKARDQADRGNEAAGLSLRSSDPNANYRIVTEGDRESAQVDADAGHTVFGVERSDRAAHAAHHPSRFPAEAFRGHVMVSGAVHERGGVKFMKVESIRRHEHNASKPDSSQPDAAKPNADESDKPAATDNAKDGAGKDENSKPADNP